MASRDTDDRPSKEENTTKKTRNKSWPVMVYTLPSERNKESREERKKRANLERIERQKKSVSKTRGRPPASSDSSPKEEKKKGKERDEKIPSGGPRKRSKAESEDEDGSEYVSAVISTPIPPSRKRLTGAEGRKREENEGSPPLPSLATSLVSPMTDDTTHATSVPASGKKQLLLRCQARAYQDRVKLEKSDAKNQELKKSAEMAKGKNSSDIPSYRKISNCEYSTAARRLMSVSRLPINRPSDIDMVKTLRDNPIVRDLFVEPKVYGIVTREEVPEGDYIAELLGYVSLEKECPNRSLVPGSLNDHTFLLEMDQDKIIIDARKCGNFTKYLRRSCKPNAVLEPILCGSEPHFMIKTTKQIDMHDEVSIKLEEGWKSKARPAQGCGCDQFKEKDECVLERFFSQKSASLAIANDSASEQPAEKNANSKKRLSKKRETAVVDDGDPMEGQQAKKRAKVGEKELIPDPPPRSRTPTSAIATPPPPSTSSSAELAKLHQELTKTQRACRAAGEAKLRAERAENLLDTKPPREAADWSGLETELEKRLADLKAQLEGARKEIDIEQSKKQAFARQNDSLKIELATSRNREEVANRGFKDLSTKNTALNDELETAKIAAAAAPTANELDVARRENAALKAELEAEKAKVAEIPNIRNEAAEEIAALTKSLETSRRLEEVANDKNDVLSRENLLLKEALAEKRK